MNSRMVEIKEPVITAQYLLDERWVGLLHSEMADAIDAACLGQEDSSPAFPTPYRHYKTLRIEKDKYLTLCFSCDQAGCDEYQPPYKYKTEDDDESFDFSKVIFKLDEVKKFEVSVPLIFCTTVDVDEEFSSHLGQAAAVENIAYAMDATESMISYPRERDTQAATTVNATKWENSVKAVFEVWSEIVLGDKADWIEDEFRTALAKRCRDYHTKVHALGWGLLPDDFKNGRGRPKKNPEKSQQSDNS